MRASPYAFDAATMKSVYRYSRRDRSWASWPALAWARWLSQVVKPDVRPPTTDPASADSAETYATSIVDYDASCCVVGDDTLDRFFWLLHGPKMHRVP